jgi:hypothetical protein
MNKKIVPVPNLAFPMLEEALYPRKFAPLIYILTFVFHFKLDPDPKPFSEPECIPAPVPLRQKVAIPVPKHCNADPCESVSTTQQI